LSTIINSYIKSKKGSCRIFPAPFSVWLRKEEDTVVEPDISVICDPDKINDRGCEGAPDWIIEIVSPSDPAHDYIVKLRKYLSAGVREYWIVDPTSEVVTVYIQDASLRFPSAYTFKDKVPAGIYGDLTIDFKEISEGL
ncbi:MAG: Uma2 family endonuclease, partial [Lachnospiraceae bacterium]|nr:Uma2 family endonuclease [Lachnospiraceae bacterium]